MREDRSTGTAEIKAVGQEILHLGARCLQAGKEWLNHRRHDMGQRYEHEDDRDIRGQGGDPSRRAASRWDEEDGGYGHSQYSGSHEQGRQRGGGSRYGVEDAGTRYPQRSSWGRDERASRYGQGRTEESDDRQRYGQGMPPGQDYGSQRNYGQSGYGAQRNYGSQDYQQTMASGQEYGSQRDYGSQRSGTQGLGYMSDRGGSAGGRGYGSYGSDAGEDLSTYGRQGSSVGGGEGYSANQREYGQSMDRGGGMQRGYRGRGPKNYARSDARITEDINERLTEADDIDAGEISVQVKDGMVTLSGTVEQRWMKHRAEDIVESCSGVKDVENRIRVERGGQSTQERSTMASGTTRRTGASASAGTASTSASSTAQDGRSGNEPGTAGTSAH